jgi:peroxiredoxin
MTLKKLYFILAISFLSLSSAQAYEGDVAQVGSIAPVFNAFSTNGSRVSLASLKGKVVLLNFFSTLCEACMVEMPYIEQNMWQVFKSDGLVVLAIGREHNNKELAEFKASNGFSFEFVADPKREIYNQYATKKIPRCYVIGKDGIIKFESVGFNEEKMNKLEDVIASELKK